ncbi:MarR family winged helix-turn-helix transcriptional regulator [Gymnodinialimonas sp.]
MTERDAELRALVGYGVKRANSAVMGEVERLLGRFGLRRTTFSALSVIAGNAGIRQSELADVLAIERPNLVQILDELQRAGWIERARDGADRRVYLLTATEAGLARVAQAGEVLRAYDARLTEGFSAAERAAFIAALRRVEENGAVAWEGRDVGEISTT